MGLRGYLARIVFIVLVAIAFSYRNEIMDMISKAVGNRETSPPTTEAKTTGQDKPPPPPPTGQDKPTTGQNEPKPSGGHKTLKEPELDYYNPPFDPENPPEPLYSKSGGTRMVTLNELAAHGHSGPLKPIWLAMMGKVFDVDKGAEHYYGPNGGYKFFTGIDGTKAFVTGEFDEEGLTDDITDLTPLQLGEIENWVKFYGDDYTYVGKLIGRYYTRDGSPTKHWYHYQKKLGEKELIKAEQKRQEKQFPGCNSHWTESTKGKVYCSEKSGGITRDWVGYPRRYFAPGTKSWRCACVHEKDLGSPQVRMYPDCDPNSHECKVDPEKIKELKARGE